MYFIHRFGETLQQIFQTHRVSMKGKRTHHLIKTNFEVGGMERNEMEYFPQDKPLAKELSIYLIELKGEEQLARFTQDYHSLISQQRRVFSQLTRDLVLFSREIDWMSPPKDRFLISIKNQFRERMERYQRSAGLSPVCHCLAS